MYIILYILYIYYIIYVCIYISYIRQLMAFRLEHLLGKAAVVENAGALQDGLQDALKETNDVLEKNHQELLHLWSNHSKLSKTEYGQYSSCRMHLIFGSPFYLATNWSEKDIYDRVASQRKQMKVVGGLIFKALRSCGSCLCIFANPIKHHWHPMLTFPTPRSKRWPLNIILSGLKEKITVIAKHRFSMFLLSNMWVSNLKMSLQATGIMVFPASIPRQKRVKFT